MKNAVFMEGVLIPSKIIKSETAAVHLLAIDPFSSFRKKSNLAVKCKSNRPHNPCPIITNIVHCWSALAGVLAGRVTYDEPLQHTAKLRAAKGRSKQEVSSSED